MRIAWLSGNTLYIGYFIYVTIRYLSLRLGLNTPALADLSDRWAGYVFGRTSMAMEVGSYSFRNVFATHCANGVLAEESFKAVIRQFEPQIKGDQLTRLWRGPRDGRGPEGRSGLRFFADEDGSGRIDLFEFMRMVGCNSNGEMGDEYYEVVPGLSGGRSLFRGSIGSQNRP